MRMQSCCFGYKTYCFYDFFVAVRVVGSLKLTCHKVNEVM